MHYYWSKTIDGSKGVARDGHSPSWSNPLIFMKSSAKLFLKQECIPVGYVPPAAVAIGGGVCLSACWDTPPLGVGLETPQARPLNFPLGCGLGNLQSMLGCHPPGDLLQSMLGYHLQCMLGYHPTPVNRITDTCKNRPCPNFVGGGNNKFSTQTQGLELPVWEILDLPPMTGNGKAHLFN